MSEFHKTVAVLKRFADPGTYHISDNCAVCHIGRFELTVSNSRGSYAAPVVVLDESADPNNDFRFRYYDTVQSAIRAVLVRMWHSPLVPMNRPCEQCRGTGMVGVRLGHRLVPGDCEACNATGEIPRARTLLAFRILYEGVRLRKTLQVMAEQKVVFTTRHPEALALAEESFLNHGCFGPLLDWLQENATAPAAALVGELRP